MSSQEGWVDAVRQVVAAVQHSDVTDLELANGSFSVRLRRQPTIAAPRSGDAAGPVDGAGFHQVVAPFTGVFYRAPTPSARPYASEGDWIEVDAIVGLVETMKIFNEVTADVSGRIVRFVAESTQLVHAGDVLVLIEPGERATAESEPHL